MSWERSETETLTNNYAVYSCVCGSIFKFYLKITKESYTQQQSLRRFLVNAFCLLLIEVYFKHRRMWHIQTNPWVRHRMKGLTVKNKELPAHWIVLKPPSRVSLICSIANCEKVFFRQIPRHSYYEAYIQRKIRISWLNAPVANRFIQSADCA